MDNDLLPCRWAFWWELCEMARRLTLVGVFVVIEQGSLMQLMIGTTFCACYTLLQTQASPYAEASCDFLANGCSFALLVFFLCCIAFKVRPSAHLVIPLSVFPTVANSLRACLSASASASASCFADSSRGRERIRVPSACALQVGTLTELNAVRAVMTEEQKRDFRNSTLALSVGLFLSVMFALVASFVILLVQLRREQIRIEREARLAKARRLRYKADGAEVEVPWITLGTPKHFHTFLSHVWGYVPGHNCACSVFGAASTAMVHVVCAGRGKTRCASSSSVSRRCCLTWRSSSTCEARRLAPHASCSPPEHTLFWT
jgi:hypothetical protein